ncbi:MAG: succinate dehydrogenase assembly factor 2 [Proteobacteria bacterium]|nr:MAG: succinate dehydrogenase assembly factor 2 [Pseudomonadota bacterium]
MSSADSLARLRWRCRRGARELDVVLERYLTQYYSRAPAGEQEAFERLLELEDPQLLALLMRRERSTDPELERVVARLADLGA